MKVPKHYQVKSAILELIAGLAPGCPVPTERELAERFSTSRTTLRQAIAELVTIAELVVDGRIERTQVLGTFVARPKIVRMRQLTSFTQDLQAQGGNPSNRILKISREKAGPEC